LEEELVVLLIHGVLHLCGYDHERSRDEALRMRRKERLMRRRLGPIGRFVRPPRRSGPRRREA
jgi:ssRNA-specific RNase YbeY (16S rRNA maturation enzyme)